MSYNASIDDEALTTQACCVPLASLIQPVEVGEIGSPSLLTSKREPPKANTYSSANNAGQATFFRWPFLGPLLFENESSDARDHCANERTFLSYLRLSVYMAIVSVAITLSFHLKSEPTHLELRMATPLGSVFWALSAMTLFAGLGNYISENSAT
ncbi:hypothetical protein G7046_g9104 [Stylonectria norvegica]|nr:hypothetical protein G7046_g9104 [Stylonectria norvegica]